MVYLFYGVLPTANNIIIIIIIKIWQICRCQVGVFLFYIDYALLNATETVMQ